MAEVVGRSGQPLRCIAAPDLSKPETVLQPQIIAALDLERGAANSVLTGGIAPHMFRATIKIGSYAATTDVISDPNLFVPCVLGGQFFQRALQGEMHRIYDLVTRDDHLVLQAAARCKNLHVLILGKYGEHRSRLVTIKTVLERLGLIGVIVDEYPDIQEQSLPEKVLTFASVCRFVIVDDVAPSGHTVELTMCSQQRFATAILRKEGISSTAMQSHLNNEVEYMKAFPYSDDSAFASAVRNAAEWGHSFVKERAIRFNSQYDWRSPQNVIS